MKQPYIEPEVQVFSLALEMGVLVGSNELFSEPTEGSWDLLGSPLDAPIETSPLELF